MVENLFITKKEIKKNSPQDGCQMVELNLILVELFHIIVTTYLHYNMHTFIISTLIPYTPDFAVH